MTQNQFSKYSFRHSEIIIYHQKHPCIDIECMLIGLDFDNGLFHLWPIDQEMHADESYWIPFQSCDKKARKPKMKIVRCDNIIKSKINYR